MNTATVMQMTTMDTAIAPAGITRMASPIPAADMQSQIAITHQTAAQLMSPRRRATRKVPIAMVNLNNARPAANQGIRANNRTMASGCRKSQSPPQAKPVERVTPPITAPSTIQRRPVSTNGKESLSCRQVIAGSNARLAAMIAKPLQPANCAKKTRASSRALSRLPETRIQNVVPMMTMSQQRSPLAKAIRNLGNGTPVWYLMAKDEGHGFSKKKNVDYQFYATVLFIQQYLLSKPVQLD